MEPARHHRLCVHEVADRLQHGLEVILLWLPANKDVECAVHICFPRIGRIHVALVLVLVQTNAKDAIVALGQLWRLAWALLNNAAVCVEHALNLTATHRNHPILLAKVCTGLDGLPFVVKLLRGRLNRNEKPNIVISEALPFSLNVGSYVEVQRDIGTHTGGFVLPQMRFADLADEKVGDGLSHSGPA